MNLKEDVVRDLIKILGETNDFVKLLWSVKQGLASDRGTNYTLHLLGKRGNNLGQYDDSSSFNVASSIVGDIRSFYSKCDIIIV